MNTTTKLLAGSEQAKAFYAENMRRVRLLPGVEEKRISAVRVSEKVKESARATQKLFVGIAWKKHPEKFSDKAGENHVTAAVFSIRSPAGVHYRFKNLRHFIRCNQSLFEDGDAVWVSYGIRPGQTSCKAYAGIHSIKPSDRKKRINGSWKGWTWVTLDDRAIHLSEDLLGRD